MNYDEFINNYKGRLIDYDGVSGAQCVDLVKVYLDNVFGIKPGAWGNANAYYDNFNNIGQLKANFNKIANTPSLVPQKGDICVWGLNHGKYGHISIATGEGTTSWFNSYDQNWGGDKKVKLVRHTYKSGFSGVLRPKDQSKINGQTSHDTSRAGSYIVNSKLNVRTSPSTAGRIVATLEEGSRQGVDYNQGNWGHLINNAGWICLDYCSMISKDRVGSYQVTANALNIRKAPKVSAKKVGVLNSGSKQGIDFNVGNWGHLMNDVGWICLDYCVKI